MAGTALLLALAVSASAAQIRVEPVPMISVGMEAETGLVLVSDATYVPGTGLFVVDRVVRTVYHFDLNGRPEGTIGAAGRGPGEFSAAIGIQRAADTLFVVDSDNRRITGFGMTGQVLREIPMRTPFVVGFAERFADGTWVLRRQSRMPSQSSRYARDSIDFIGADSFLGDPQAIVRVAAGLGVRYVSAGRERVGIAHLSPKASGAVWGQCLYATSTDEAVITVVAKDNSFMETLTYRPPPLDREVTADIRRRYIDYWGDRPPPGVPPSTPQERARASRSDGFASLLPVSTGLFLDPGGFVWLPDYEFLWQLSDAVTVLTPDLENQFRVTLPRGLRVVEVGHDFIVGLTLGPAGEQVVQVYSIVREESPAGGPPAACVL